MAKGEGSAGRSVNERMHAASERASARYSAWVASQPEAKREIDEIIARAKTIPSATNRAKFMRREKHDFDTRWSNKYGDRNMTAKQRAELAAKIEAARMHTMSV